MAESTPSLLETISNSLPLGIKLPPEVISLTASLPTTQEATAMFAGKFTGITINIAISLGIIIGGWIFASWLASFATRALMRGKMEETAAAFLGSMARYVVVFIAIMVALSMLGVTSTGMIAVLGAAGLAVGLSLKDFLTHIAAGVMLLLTQPFKVGQFITCGEFMGTVKRITLFNTELNTVTNQRIYMPNGAVWNNTIINHNYNTTRQVEVSIRTSYDDDIALVTQVLKDTMLANPLVRNEPAPFAGAEEYSESGIRYTVRCWVKTSDWGTVRYNILHEIRQAFDAHGITIPWPQQVQHLYEAPRYSATTLKNRKKVLASIAEAKTETAKKEVAKAEAAANAAKAKTKPPVRGKFIRAK